MSVVKVLLVLVLVSSAAAIFGIRGDTSWLQLGNRLGGGNGNGLGLGLGNGNNNGNRNRFFAGLVRGKNSVCNGTGTDATTGGVCDSRLGCQKRGGRSSGTCALVGSCCIITRSCGNSTQAKVSYFDSSALQAGETLPTSCAFRIDPYNSNVCQIRLDFERFSLAGPDGVFNCVDDIFTITGVPNLGINGLCGENTGQHIYIPVNMASSIMLNIALAMNRTGLTAPNWRIKVTQLECETDNFNTAQSNLASLVQRAKNKKNNNARTDNFLLAPPGCLQYFPWPTGTYESFNYNNGAGFMLANTNYAVCFRRDGGVCGITHTADTFQIGANEATGLGELCRGVSNDFLQIPGSDQTLYCDSSLVGNPVTSRNPGPLQVTVNTDGVQSGFAETGFRINYNTISGNC